MYLNAQRFFNFSRVTVDILDIHDVDEKKENHISVRILSPSDKYHSKMSDPIKCV